jgi:hypothetical protein
MARREGRCPQSPGMIAVRNLKVQKRPLAETSGRDTTLTQASATLFPLRTLTGIEPVVIAPAGVDYWHTTRRLKACEVYALPRGDCSALMTPFAWLAFTRRDVCFWPIDVLSSCLMTLIVQALTQPAPPNGPMAVIRWAWGHPAAEELGEPDAVIETLWRRNPAGSDAQEIA